MAQGGQLTPSATEKSLPSRDAPGKTRPPKHLTSMEELGKAAQETLHYINNNKERLGDEFIIGFVNRVREFAKTANPGEATDALASFRKALEQVQQDTALIRKEITAKQATTVS